MSNTIDKIYKHSKTDVGKRREHNEDSIIDFSKSDNNQILGVFGVADGVGGASAGEVASNKAKEKIEKYFSNYQSYCQKFKFDTFEIENFLKTSFERINREIYKTAKEKGKESNMGTTLSVGVIYDDNTLFFGHVGDTRIYLIRNNEIEQITTDHSFIETQIRKGLMTREEAQHSKLKNVLEQAVGYDETVRVDTSKRTLKPEDTIVFCSDGLHGLVSDEEIKNYSLSYKPENATSNLINLANDRGGKDNISVVVVRFKPNSVPKDIGLPNQNKNQILDTKFIEKSKKQNYIMFLPIIFFVIFIVSAIFILFKPSNESSLNKPQNTTKINESDSPKVENSLTPNKNNTNLIDELNNVGEIKVTPTPRPIVYKPIIIPKEKKTLNNRVTTYIKYNKPAQKLPPHKKNFQRSNFSNDPPKIQGSKFK